MKTLNVGEFKAHFSEVLEDVKKGKKITISFGRRKEKLAVIVPYKSYMSKERKIGLLENKATYKIHKDFKISEEKFLQL
ncbi:hypothetical protein MNBD_UNCLBAC01-1481 [hydrothermal vent metagenome]|uniref:Antitoxin n=1 Tax=hydrothermal vent metagenome TaxID=652676 RepID=A0A3B1DAI5_9ZZZZ